MVEKLSESDVRHVAKLSRLALSDDAIVHFRQQLSSILQYMSKLGELDVSEVEPMSPLAVSIEKLRQDVAAEGLGTEAVLRNAPVTSPPFFRVPKVLGEGSGA